MATKTKSASKKNTSGALVPGGFRTGAVMPRKPIQSGGGSAFVWVAHTMSGMWGDIAAKIKGLKNADLVYVNGDHVERLQPMKYHLVEAFHFFATADRDGDFLQTWDESADDIPKEAGEYVEAVLVVYTANGVRAARMTFKKAMCKAIGSMIREYHEALEPAWASRNAENKLAAEKVPEELNGFRFYGVASAAPKTTKDGKNTYPAGSVQVKASTSTEFQALRDIDDDFQVELAAARAAFESRVGHVRSLIK